MTRPSWLGRAVRNRHRHAIEQASRRLRGGRLDDSARTRRKILISTQVRKLNAKGISISWPTIKSRLERISNGRSCKNWYYLPPPDGRKLVFKEIRSDPTDESDTDSDPEESNKRIKLGIRIKIKGEGDAEDTILIATDFTDGVRNCVEINQCVGCTRQFFTKSFLSDDAGVLAPSSGEEPASPRHRAGAASIAP